MNQERAGGGGGGWGGGGGGGGGGGWWGGLGVGGFLFWGVDGCFLLFGCEVGCGGGGLVLQEKSFEESSSSTI